MAIYTNTTASAQLKSYFETGDVPTADNFTDLIDSFAIYDGTLPLISGSGTGTGSFQNLKVSRIDSVLGTSITISSSLLPHATNTFDLGSDAIHYKKAHIVTASISGYISGNLNPITTNTYNLGTDDLKYKDIKGSSGSFDIISSSLIPRETNISDLGTTARRWKDAYISGSSYIDTIIGTSIPSITGSMLVSGTLLPGEDDKFDLGSSGKEWKDLYIDGTAYIDTLSLSALANDIDINSISSSNQMVNVSGSIKPATDDTYDLGTSGLQWKDLYLDGVAHIDTIGAAADMVTNAYLATASIDTLNASGSLGSSIRVSASLTPGNTAKHDLGSSTYQWKDLHVSGTANLDIIGTAADEVTNAYVNIATLSQINASGSVTGRVTVSGSLIPGANTTLHNLGTSSLEWNDLHVGGTSYIDHLSGSGAAGDAHLTASLNIVPGIDDTYNLGIAGREWKDLHVDGTANIDALSTDTASIGRVATHLVPTVDNSKNIGSDLFQLAKVMTVTASISGYVSSSLIPHKDDTYDLGSSTYEWKDLYIDGTATIDAISADTANITSINTSLSGSTYSTVLTTSASVASIKLKNLPTTEAQARLIGTGSLYLGGPSGSNSRYLVVFTGGN